MGGLVIGVFPQEAAVLSGESMMVETVFENHGDKPIEVVDSDAPSQFLYELLDARDRHLVMSLSQILRDERRSRDLPPPEVYPMVALEPGRRLTREEDLADYAANGIAPGKYLLRAKYPHDNSTAESALAPITIQAPTIESFSSEVCQRLQTLTTVFAHRRTDGGTVVLQRESLPDPQENVFMRRVKLPAGAPVTVATAIDAVNAGNGRWFAWLRDGMLAAAVGWGNRTVARPEAIRAGEASSRLLSPGFQIDVGEGMFGVVTRQGGKVVLQTVKATGEKLELMWQADLGTANENEMRWNFRPEQGATVMWRDAASSLVYQRHFDMNGKAREGEATVVIHVAAIAWDLPPLGEPVVRIVAQDAVGRLRLGMSTTSGAPTATRIPRLGEVTAWALCGYGDRKTKIVAVAGGKLWSTEPAGAGWTEIGPVQEVRYLHAFSPRGRTCWAEWFEPGYGIRRVRIP